MENRFSRLAIEALFPRFCLSCKREGQIFCLGCSEHWIARPEPVACPFCHERGSNRTCVNCKKTNFLDGLVSYLPYGNPIVRGAIGCWKYDGDRSVEETLKQWLLQSKDRLQPTFLEVSVNTPGMKDFVVTYVPIHKTRQRMRGFDQSEVLSNWVGEMCMMPVETLLIRSCKTKPQAKQGHDVRRVGLLDGIFQIHPNITKLPSRVLLCDDVFTSGATMDAAAKCLKEVGVEEVWGFVIAKGSHEA